MSTCSEWLPGNAGAISGAVNDRYTVLLAGNYYLVTTTGHGCSDTSDAISIIVNTMPHASLLLEGDTIFCSGNSAFISTTSGPGYTWRWRRNGQDIAAAVDSFFEVRFSGAYDVIVSAGNSCVDTSVIQEITVMRIAGDDGVFIRTERIVKSTR